jgi:hypothetical protein
VLTFSSTLPLHSDLYHCPTFLTKKEKLICPEKFFLHTKDKKELTFPYLVSPPPTLFNSFRNKFGFSAKAFSYNGINAVVSVSVYSALP